MAKFVKTLVGLPMHVAMVNGLNRYLWSSKSSASLVWAVYPHAAATAMLSHFISFLGDVNRREEPDSPDSEM